MKGSTTYILLIRHGENDWVGSDRLAGRTPGVHLNEKGHAQSEQLAEMLAGQPISAVYSSPLKRCMETATPVAAKFGLTVVPEPGDLEVDYGEWCGRELKELTKTPDWHHVQHYPSIYRFPDGETLREVQTRAVTTLERICADHPNQLVAVFSHGDVIRTTLAHFMGTPLDLFQRIMISTASISGLAFHEARPAVLFTNYVADLPTFEWKKEEEAEQAEGAVQSETEPSA